MRNLKFIIAGLVLGLLASCSEDGLETIDEQCGCISRVITKVSYTLPGGEIYTNTHKGDWGAAPCGKPGIKAGPGNSQIETKCN